MACVLFCISCFSLEFVVCSDWFWFCFLCSHCVSFLIGSSCVPYLGTRTCPAPCSLPDCLCSDYLVYPDLSVTFDLFLPEPHLFYLPDFPFFLSPLPGFWVSLTRFFTAMVFSVKYNSEIYHTLSHRSILQCREWQKMQTNVNDLSWNSVLHQWNGLLHIVKEDYSLISKFGKAKVSCRSAVLHACAFIVLYIYVYTYTC